MWAFVHTFMITPRRVYALARTNYITFPYFSLLAESIKGCDRVTMQGRYLAHLKQFHPRLSKDVQGHSFPVVRGRTDESQNL